MKFFIIIFLIVYGKKGGKKKAARLEALKLQSTNMTARYSNDPVSNYGTNFKPIIDKPKKKKKDKKNREKKKKEKQKSQFPTGYGPTQYVETTKKPVTTKGYNYDTTKSTAYKPYPRPYPTVSNRLGVN